MHQEPNKKLLSWTWSMEHAATQLTQQACLQCCRLVYIVRQAWIVISTWLQSAHDTHELQPGLGKSSLPNINYVCIDVQTTCGLHTLKASLPLILQWYLQIQIWWIEHSANRIHDWWLSHSHTVNTGQVGQEVNFCPSNHAYMCNTPNLQKTSFASCQQGWR